MQYVLRCTLFRLLTSISSSSSSSNLLFEAGLCHGLSFSVFLDFLVSVFSSSFHLNLLVLSVIQHFIVSVFSASFHLSLLVHSVIQHFKPLVTFVYFPLHSSL
jgi:hypothetical protein